MQTSTQQTGGEVITQTLNGITPTQIALLVAIRQGDANRAGVTRGDYDALLASGVIRVGSGAYLLSEHGRAVADAVIVAQATSERDDWEHEKKHGKYSVASLRSAFTLVAPRDNWKSAIDAVVSEGNVEICSEAITFMVGGTVKVERVTGGVRLTSPGYYVNIGA